MMKTLQVNLSFGLQDRVQRVVVLASALKRTLVSQWVPSASDRKSRKRKLAASTHWVEARTIEKGHTHSCNYIWLTCLCGVLVSIENRQTLHSSLSIRCQIGSAWILSQNRPSLLLSEIKSLESQQRHRSPALIASVWCRGEIELLVFPATVTQAH